MYPDEYTALRNFAAEIVDFNETEWQAHRDLLTRRFLRKGEYLSRQGEVCNYVSFINSGSLRVFRIANEQEFSKHFFFEREYASDYSSFLTRNPGLWFIRALEDTELMELNYDKVQRLYDSFPVWQKYGRLIAEKLFIQVADRSQELLLKTPEEMYIRLIETQSPILSRIPQQYIASYLGIQPESLSRIRKRIMEFKKV